METTTTGDAGRAPGLDVDRDLVNDIAALVNEGRRAMVVNIVGDLYAPDVAELLQHLPREVAQQVFDWLDVDGAAEVLPEVDPRIRLEFLTEAPPDRATLLIDRLDSDDAADILAELPDDVRARLLYDLSDAGDLRALLTYDEDTAGGIMGTELVAVSEDVSVDDATEEVRRRAEIVEHVYSIFVVDDAGKLVGVVALKALLLSPASALIRHVMDQDVISVTPDIDQEEVARIMERYDLVSLPVVDMDGVLIGRITIDDVVDVIREEAEEDFQLMHGVSGSETPNDSVLRISRGRLPWLLVGLVGAGLSASVIGNFEESLETAVVLAIFIPIVTAMGGNAAVQSAAIAVQGLSTGNFWPGDFARRIGKEFLVAVVDGLVLGLLVGSAVWLLQLGDVRLLATTVSLTMFSVIVLGTTNGALIPFALNRAGIDPAKSMGPFVTTMNDIIGLTVYFLIATAIYL
jgi:magnesium transporter